MMFAHSYHVLGTYKIIHSLILGTIKWNIHSIVKEGMKRMNEYTEPLQAGPGGKLAPSNYVKGEGDKKSEWQT